MKHYDEWMKWQRRVIKDEYVKAGGVSDKKGGNAPGKK